MKHIYSIILIISIIFIVLSCQNEEKKTAVTVNDNSEQNQDSTILDPLLKRANNKIYLLSYKYELSDTIVKDIIIKYMNEFEPLDVDYLLMKAGETDTNLYNRLSNYPPNLKCFIDTLSLNYGVSKKKISKIIFDYKLLSSIEDIDKNK